jgi:non-heme chloroperoxidase
VLCDPQGATFNAIRPPSVAWAGGGDAAASHEESVSNQVTKRRCLSASPMATAEVWRSSFHADHRAGRQAITVLVLIIHGAADQSATIDLTGQRTASLVPGCRYKEYPTVGHGLYVTHAKRLNTDLLDFIKS